MSRKKSYPIALGGVLAALAVVFMSLGGLIPVATYLIPVLCAMMLELVRRICGGRIGWAWYGAVSILGLLLCPDKEAAGVFLFLGNYPLVRPALERLPAKKLWKLLYFNSLTLLLYWLLLQVLGMNQIREDLADLGRWGAVSLLSMGNVLFILLDVLLGREFRWRR